MAAGTAKHPRAGALRSVPPSACSKDCSNTNEQGANRRPSLGPARALKTICSSATCSARFELAKSSTNAGCASRSRRFGTRQGLLQYFKTFWSECEGRKREAILMANIKTTLWALGLLAILSGFELAAPDDYKGFRSSEHKIPTLPS